MDCVDYKPSVVSLSLLRRGISEAIRKGESRQSRQEELEVGREFHLSRSRLAPNLDITRYYLLSSQVIRRGSVWHYSKEW